MASVPAPGPSDLIADGSNGAIDEDLGAACARAIGLSRADARASTLAYTFEYSHARFRDHLVPMSPEVPFVSPAERGLS